jgi:hypothetical protein
MKASRWVAGFKKTGFFAELLKDTMHDIFNPFLFNELNDFYFC